MKRRLKFIFALTAGLLLLWILAFQIPAYFHGRVLRASLRQIADLIEPPSGAAPRTLTTHLKIVKATGIPVELAGHSVDLAFQAPDHIRVSSDIIDASYTVGRDGQQLWVYDPATKFGVIGQSGLPRFAAEPDVKDTTQLAPLSCLFPEANCSPCCC